MANLVDKIAENIFVKMSQNLELGTQLELMFG